MSNPLPKKLREEPVDNDDQFEELFFAETSEVDFAKKLNESNRIKDKFSQAGVFFNKAIKIKLRWLIVGGVAVGASYLALHNDNPSAPEVPAKTEEQIRDDCAASIPDKNISPADMMIYVQSCVDKSGVNSLLQPQKPNGS